MTGLDVEKDQILEMACLITDCDLNVLAEVSAEPGAASRSPPLRPHEGSGGPGIPSCPNDPLRKVWGTLCFPSLQGPNLIINQPDELLDGMSEWCKEHHGKVRNPASPISL